MKPNWIVTQARNADHSRDVVILEKPAAKDYLDGLLVKRFWPVILRNLQEAGYSYLPANPPKTEFELSYEYARSLTFMLFDDGKAFFKGKLRCSKESWVIESEFFLSLLKETELDVLRELLGNTRLVGNPPTLIVDKRLEGDFYQIHFHGGNGASWGLMGEKKVDERIKQVIDTNVEMYERSVGQISAQNLGTFLTVAYDVYEAY